MKAKDAEGAVDNALETMKNSSMGEFKSPMGRGMVIKAKPEYGEGEVEHHHFLTHGPDGKALALPQHFVMRTRTPGKKDKGNMPKMSG